MDCKSADNDDATGELSKTVVKEEEDELQKLLESALDDFETSKGDTVVVQQPVQEPQTTTTPTKKGKAKKKQTKKETSIPLPEGFPSFDPAMMGHVDEVFKNMLGSDPLLKEHWDKLAESCSRAAAATTDEDFEASLTDTLKSLSQNAESLIKDNRAANLPQDDLSRMLQQLGVPEDGMPEGAGGGLIPDIMPMITQMMQNLLSKDILYPALKDLTSKYPKWLEDNKETLSEADLTRYSKQLDLMRTVCHEFEADSEDDSSEEKNSRFQRILSSMQAMQECGSPPKDLVGDVPDGSEDITKIFGNLSAGTNPQCCIQ